MMIIIYHMYTIYIKNFRNRVLTKLLVVQKIFNA